MFSVPGHAGRRGESSIAKMKTIHPVFVESRYPYSQWEAVQQEFVCVRRARHLS
ncbi:hypothetical protein IEO21_01261 [Rhodonia placenta]|uniref:Uncharacterized protein n=1 Tax=Rhodonia placenta TaxID=104341 RepID=A0A8H7PA16_9APHY|nr:hypothetical protein IEO21_01261 [Postia placenta]